MTDAETSETAQSPDRAVALDVQFLLAPRLFELVVETTGPRVATLLDRRLPRLGSVRPGDVRPGSVRIDADDNERFPDSLVRVMADARECPLPSRTPLTALAYTVGDSAVSPGLDADAVVARLTAAEGGPERALPDWLGLLGHAALTGDPDRPGAVWTGVDAQPGSDVLKVLVNPAYLRALTIDGGPSELFHFARDSLFIELGVPLPPIQLRRDPGLRPGGFAFQLPGLTVLPRLGLEPGNLLVNSTVEQLTRMNITGTPTINPSTDQPGAIVSAEHHEALTAAGYTTWDPIGYLVLCFADAVRFSVDRYVTEPLVSGLLEQLAGPWPFLVEVVHDRLELADVVSVLRALTREQVCVRNLRRILERLLRAVDEAVPAAERLTYVRAGLADQIAAKMSRETGTIVVYLLDPILEHVMTQPEPPAPSVIGRVRHAIAAEHRSLPPSAQIPVILTQDECRLPVYEALAPAFPRVQVIGYSDVPAAINIQPVDRISIL